MKRSRPDQWNDSFQQLGCTGDDLNAALTTLQGTIEAQPNRSALHDNPLMSVGELLRSVTSTGARMTSHHCCWGSFAEPDRPCDPARRERGILAVWLLADAKGAHSVFDDVQEAADVGSLILCDRRQPSEEGSNAIACSGAEWVTPELLGQETGLRSMLASFLSSARATLPTLLASARTESYLPCVA